MTGGEGEGEKDGRVERERESREATRGEERGGRGASHLLTAAIILNLRRRGSLDRPGARG